MNTFGQRACVGALAFVFTTFGTASHAEDIEITHCYSGTFVTFSQIKDVPILVSWAQNGIVMSAHPKKLLHNAVVRCEGVQIGGGASRSGHGFCKIVDDDGDAYHCPDSPHGARLRSEISPWHRKMERCHWQPALHAHRTQPAEQRCHAGYLSDLPAGGGAVRSSELGLATPRR